MSDRERKSPDQIAVIPDLSSTLQGRRKAPPDPPPAAEASFLQSQQTTANYQSSELTADTTVPGIRTPEAAPEDSWRLPPTGEKLFTLSPQHMPHAALHTAAPPALPALSPEERYEGTDEIARGGLGRILKTYDTRLSRPVAMKEILHRQDAEVEERFLKEALITARLEHPSIVPVYDMGRWAEGSAFYTMKLVNGRSFDKVIDEKKTLPERLELLSHAIDICDAMAYAHTQKIIHRDLKPANVLIGPFGETVVIDWGIAKEIGERPFGPGERGEGRGERGQTRDRVWGEESSEELPGSLPKEHPSRSGPSSLSPLPSPLFTPDPSAGLTEDGTILGTPAYMSPEQARGKPLDARTDVYSLGGILYRMLSGHPPYGRKKSSVGVISAILDGPPPPLESLSPDIPKDLAAIVTKAMARDPSARYPSAKELAEDLKKFQNGQVVGVYRYSNMELLRRFIRRNRNAVIIASLLFYALLLVGVYSYVQIFRANEGEREARIQAEKKALVAEAAEAEKSAKALALTLQLARESLETNPSLSLSYLKELVDYPGFTAWNRVRTLTGDALLRGVPRVLGAPWSPGGQGHTLGVLALAFSPGGSHLASASYDGTVRLWDARTGAEEKVLKGHKDLVSMVRFSPDGTLLASAGGESDSTVRLWEVKSGKELAVFSGHKGAVVDIVFSPDGGLLASAGQDGTARLFSVSLKEEWLPPFLHKTPVTQVRFSPNGDLLASISQDRAPRLWNTLSGEQVAALKGHTDMPNAIAFSPRGDLLASAGEDKKVILWDLSEGLQNPKGKTLSGHDWEIKTIAFSPDGKTLASAGEDRSVRLWDVARCLERKCGAQPLLAHQGTVLAVAFSPDGKRLASAGQDQTIRLWDVASKKEAKALRAHSAAIRALAFSPDGEVLASAGEDKTIRLWDLPGLEQALFYGHKGFAFAVDVSPDGKLIASGGEDKTLRLWDAKTKEERARFQAGGSIWETKFSPDGKLIAAGSADGAVYLWETSGALRTVLYGHTDEVYGLAFSLDGKLLASSSIDRSIRLWDVASGATRKILSGHTDEVLDLAFSPDGETLASASYDGTVRFWDPSRGAEIGRIETKGGAKRRFSSVAFSPDGKLFAAGNYSAELLVWRLSGPGEVAGEGRLLTGHRGEVEALDFSPDSRTLASASWDGTARLWSLDEKNWEDLAHWESRVLYSYGKDVDALAFFPDGKKIIFASEDELLHLFTDALPHEPEALSALLHSIPTPPTEKNGK